MDKRKYIYFLYYNKSFYLPFIDKRKFDWNMYFLLSMKKICISPYRYPLPPYIPLFWLLPTHFPFILGIFEDIFCKGGDEKTGLHQFLSHELNLKGVLKTI